MRGAIGVSATLVDKFVMQGAWVGFVDIDGSQLCNRGERRKRCARADIPLVDDSGNDSERHKLRDVLTKEADFHRPELVEKNPC